MNYRLPSTRRRSVRLAGRGEAYQWAERRRLETHPKTGAAQLVELRETVQEVIVPVYAQEERKAPPKAALFAEIAAERMLAYGVPVSWLDDVLAATEDNVLDVAAHLPAEAAEAVLCLAVGGTPVVRAVAPVETPAPEGQSDAWPWATRHHS